MPTMAIEEAQKIKTGPQRSPRRGAGRAGRPRPPVPRDARELDAAAASRMPQPQRSPAEIRDSIEANRQQLVLSVDRLRGEVTRITDWRAHVERHRPEIMAGAAVVGLFVGVRMLRRRSRATERPAAVRLSRNGLLRAAQNRYLMARVLRHPASGHDREVQFPARTRDEADIMATRESIQQGWAGRLPRSGSGAWSPWRRCSWPAARWRPCGGCATAALVTSMPLAARPGHGPVAARQRASAACVWEKQPGSEDLLFNELMVWGYIHRLRKQRRLASVANLGATERRASRAASREQRQLLEGMVSGDGDARPLPARALPPCGPALLDDRPAHEAAPRGSRPDPHGPQRSTTSARRRRPRRSCTSPGG